MKPISLTRSGTRLLISFLIVLGFWSNYSLAQTRTGRKHHIFRKSAEKKAKKLSHRQTRKYHLSPDQAKKIAAINQKYGQKVDLLKSQVGLDQKTRMERLKVLEEERNNEYKNVLRPNQFKKWNDWEIRKPQQPKEFKEKKADHY